MPVAAARALPEAKTPDLYARFSAAMDALLAPAPHTPPSLAVALSGGADSMALALLAAQYASAHGGQMRSFTVDHRLRAGSTREAEQVASWMAARGIAHQILTPAHVPASRNRMEAARIWRYDALAEACARASVLHCLIAHHAGDNRETVLHHQARGDTADGGAGMAAARAYRGVRLLRPLLHIERAALENFLRAQNQPWVEDPTNRDPRWARTRNRAFLADNPSRIAALDAEIAEHAAARRTREIARTGAALRTVTLHPLGFAQMNLAAWRKLEPTLAQQLLADLLTTISGRTHRPRGGETARLAYALTQPEATKRTLHGCELTVRGDHLLVAREHARVEAPAPLCGQGQAYWDNRFRVQYAVSAGSTFQIAALGHLGRKQLAALGVAQALARALPRATPALWHLDTLVFVPHIGMQCPPHVRIALGFAPAKPLADAPFWWFNHDQFCTV
jgi:tRNA(Ile)-lysidine synthase